MKREKDDGLLVRIFGNVLGNVLGWILYIGVVLGLTYLIITYVGQRTQVSGSSMETTLQDGDNLIVDKLSYRFRAPKRFDIVVFPYLRAEKNLLHKAYHRASRRKSAS